MNAARGRWPNKVKILGTGRLGPLEKSVAPWVGDPVSRLFQEDSLPSIYSNLFAGEDTSHKAFQLLEKRLDLQIRVLGFLRQVFKRSIHLKQTRKGLQVLGVNDIAGEYQIVDECHGLKELITILTFLYDDTFSVLGIDEPELHLHPQFQRFLLDEIRAVAGSPDSPGKKLIFLVTHSPILLDIRHISDLTSIIVFNGDGKTPQRAVLDVLSSEQLLKIRQALPSFHAAQRELLFSSTPVLVEGPTDASIILNVATKTDLPLGAAGIGISTLGGKTQLLAFRALLAALGKSQARFILDLDTVVDTKTLSALDGDPAVVEILTRAGNGGRSLSQEAGELISLLRNYLSSRHAAGTAVGPIAPGCPEVGPRELGIILGHLRKHGADGDAEASERAKILGKCDLIRAAARAANVLILRDGPIEAYYETPPSLTAGDFAKREALQTELDHIWSAEDSLGINTRYQEVISFIAEGGLLKLGIADLALEPIADLIHLLQTDIAGGRIASLAEAQTSSRAKADGYWYICELTDLSVASPTKFNGTLRIKQELGGAIVTFDQDTRAYQVGRE
jgi:hypothetical protein